MVDRMRPPFDGAQRHALIRGIKFD